EAALGFVPAFPRIRMFHFGLDYRNRASVCFARTLWLLGYSDQAARLARRAAEEAEFSDHPLTLCIGLIFAVTVFLWIGDWATTGEIMDRLVAHARRRFLVPYESAGLGVAGYISVKRGDAEAGVLLLRTSLEAMHARRYRLLTTAFNGTLAEGLAKTGRFDDALKTIDETIALVERSGDLVHMPELLRIKGEILLRAAGTDPGQAEDWLVRSLDLAGRLSTLAWQLRTATGLA